MPVKRKNILWICTDQQRFDTLGCYGNRFVHTPNLDRLAENGVLFEHCYVQSPVCSPSRASFLTGRYPRTTRCRQNGQSIPFDELLVTRILADAGYRCGLAGKLHVSACEKRRIERRIDDGYIDFHWSHEPYPADPPAENEYLNWLEEKGVPFEQEPFRDSQWVRRGMPVEYHQTTWCAEKAIQFIEENTASQTPWLFSVNIFDPHHEFDPPESYLQRYLGRLHEIPLPNYTLGELDNKPIFQTQAYYGDNDIPGSYAAAKMTAYDHRLIRAAYWAMVELIDEQIGRILTALERTGQLQETIVIFMSDHGEMLGDHGIYLKGPYFYEPAIRVPLIISCPGLIPSGRRISGLVELVDVAPTLLDAVGIDRPVGMQGQSLWPLVSGRFDSGYGREDIYCEYYNANMERAYATMVRTERYKIVAFHGLGTGELYDLKEDPNETYNRWDDVKYVPVKVEMLTRLCDRMAWTVDPLPERKGRW